MRILYVTPLIPSTSGTGGKRAVFNHLLDLVRSGDAVELVCVNVEEDTSFTSPCPGLDAISVFPRSIPRARNRTGQLRGLLQLFFDPLPRAASVVASDAARSHVHRAIEAGRHDAVVVDHLSAWSLVSGMRIGPPLVYIAHNSETDIISQQAGQPGQRPLERFRLRIEAAKTARLEREALQRADSIIAIAATDLESVRLKFYVPKSTVWPELPLLKPIQWRGDSTGHVLFVGSAKYHPNLDAIEWLVLEFMPNLRRNMPQATLRIAGTAAADVPHLAADPSVIFEGFVDDARLQELHVTASAFISPVTLGSGIKIKVLEAASYGVPVVATHDSLRGINFLAGAALPIEKNGSTAAAKVAAWLADSSALSTSSKAALMNLRAAISDRPPLSTLLGATQKHKTLASQ